MCPRCLPYAAMLRSTHRDHHRAIVAGASLARPTPAPSRARSGRRRWHSRAASPRGAISSSRRTNGGGVAQRARFDGGQQPSLTITEPAPNTPAADHLPGARRGCRAREYHPIVQAISNNGGPIQEQSVQTDFGSIRPQMTVNQNTPGRIEVRSQATGRSPRTGHVQWWRVALQFPRSAQRPVPAQRAGQWRARLCQSRRPAGAHPQCRLAAYGAWCALAASSGT